MYPPDGVRFLVFWVTVAGVIVICLYGVEESKLLIKELDDVSRLENDDDYCLRSRPVNLNVVRQ